MNVCIVGSANADLIVEVDRRPVGGETLLGSDLTVLPGGKGANQAVAASKLFDHVSFVGAIGADGNGVMLRESMAAAGLDLSGLAVAPAPTGCALIVVTPDGENSIIVAPGANRKVTPAALAASDVWRAASVVVSQLEIPLESVAFLAAECVTNGQRFVLNAAPIQALPPDVLAACDPLVVNESEAAFLANLPDVSDATATARALLSLGPKSVVITLGGRGALAIDRDGEVIFQPAESVPVVDTTGAGDAFVGVLSAVLSTGGSLRTGMELGSRVAAFAIGRRGAQTSYPSRGEIEIS